MVAGRREEGNKQMARVSSGMVGASWLGEIVRTRGDARGSLLRTLGYLCHRMWINLIFFSTALFQNYSASEAVATADEVYRTSIIALAVSLVMCALLHVRVMRALQRDGLEYVGPALTGIGIVMLVPDLTAGASFNVAVLYGSAVFTGFGSCLTLLSVGRRFVGVDVGTCIANVLWATLGCALLTFAVSFLPTIAAVGIVIILPFLTVACLHGIKLQKREGSEMRWSLGERISKRMIAKFVTCAVVLDIVAGLTRDLYSASGYGTYGQTFQTAWLVASCAVVALLLVIIAYSKKATIETLYKLTVLVETAGFAVMPLAGDNITVPYVVVATGSSLFEMLGWVILSDIASRFQYTSVQVFGFGRALILVVGVIVGMVVAHFLNVLGDASSVLVVTSAVSIICICFLRTYVLTSSDLERFERGMSEGLWSEDDMPGENAPGLTIALASSEPGIPPGAGTETAVPGAAASSTLGAGANPAAGPGSRSLPRKVPFQRKCAIIGEFYGLTRRETDVFRLLAAGRNSTRIQEELAISAGTVNTHSYHVFQKLGVHRQQEVIDLLEQADLDAIQAELARRRAEQ